MTTNDDETGEDLDVECAVFTEYGYALATAAERCLRYPDVLRMARSRAERDHIRAAHRGFIRRTIAANTVALSLLGDEPSDITKEKAP